MNNEYTYDDYKLIIDILFEEHQNYTGKWLSHLNKTQYNLKKTLVRDVCSSDPDNIDGFIDNIFLDYIDDYKSILLELYTKIIFRLSHEGGIVLKGRIKGDDSILLKLHRKRFEDGGKFPLNKYLNDILGFRLIDVNFKTNSKQIYQYISKLKEQKKRLTHKYRENGDYKGYHIYFMGTGARFFPMELQIWDNENERINLVSHENYKKDYTYWPKIYTDG